MRKFKLLMVATLLSYISGYAYNTESSDSTVNRIIYYGTNDNQTMNHLDILANRIGGRLVGSDAYENATYWLANLLNKWGLEVEIQEVGELPVGFNRGAWFGKMIYDGGKESALHFVTPSYTAGTKGVQRGGVVKEPKTQEEFDAIKDRLKGSWVLITGKSEGWAIDYSEYADTLRSIIISNNCNFKKDSTIVSKDSPALFYRQMKEAGILGIIQSATVPLRALYDKNNLMNMSFEKLPDLPDIKLDAAQYNMIAERVKNGEEVMLEFEIRNFFKPGPVKFHNVIGILRGSEYPDEYVMSGGHLDAFDVGTGSVDCGTGVATNMEVARLLSLSEAKPKRSIALCFWAAEEFGIWGSSAWVAKNSDKLGRVSNYFNRDGGPTVTSSLTVPPAMYDDFEQSTAILNSINSDFPFKLYKRKGEPPYKPKEAGGSDHAPFALNGVPTISFYTSDPKKYGFSYYEIWHTERDTYNKSFPDYMEHSSVVMAVVLYNLANLDHLLSREDLYRKD